MSLWSRIKARYHWEYIGTVRGNCRWIMGGKDSGIIESVFWSLYVRGDGKRRFKVVGDPEWAGSAHVKEMQALVKVWKSGGPIPPLDRAAHQATPPKPKAKLISFPGGKGYSS